ncbi:MAG: PD-(D/E)XK nuclease domain-containing protein [Acidiferrobacter sp.]
MEEGISPERYWHCSVKMIGTENPSVVNDLSFQDLEKTIVSPWNARRPFTVAGTLVRSTDSVESIRITHTDQPQSYYARHHEQRMSAAGICDLSTNRKLLPISKGTDRTHELLFSGIEESTHVPDVDLVERLCKRLPQAARILAIRSRKGKAGYEITDEYDVQDLLHALMRGYLKYSVQEDPLPKVAGAKSGRVDISVDDLGILIEIKYVHGPEDQKRLLEEYSQDLVLYAQWVHLRTLIYLIYNSADLRDAEAFERLTSTQEIGGKRFDVRIILA